jgi:hypothetical protein
MPAPVCAAPPSWGRHPQTCTISDSCNAQTQHPYSITSVTRANRFAGISRPSALAVLRLMTNSYLVGLPFRIIRGREELTNVSDKDPTRDVVKFAVEQLTNILTSQRKKIAQLPDQCARSALALAKS